MADIPVNVANNVIQRSVDQVINEAHYLCCFNSYVDKFEKEKERLAAKHQDVKIEIENASGVFRVKNEARQWAREADNLINVDTKTKKKCFFGLCPNCFWQYQTGKELAEKTLEINNKLGSSNFNIEAGPADYPGIKYYSSQNFIHFEGRKLKFQDLKEALEDESCNVIGLQGMGGTGKTSLAIKVGAELEKSKFDKVILLVVSKPPNFKKIRGEIARHLNLTLEEGKEEEHSKKIWSKITNMKEKLLIILDDVWEKFDLIKELGIPSSHQHKGCSVLITTRNSSVCTAMGCPRPVQLQTLTDEDALNLFLTHANINNSSYLKGLAQNIVKQCGGVPIAIVAVARSLKNRPPAVWKEALKTLKLDVNENLTEAYKCLKLSYDNLKNEKARELFLISSLFPEDSEIPIELLSKIGIGVGLHGKVDKYYVARSKMLDAIQELLDSCLLLNAEEECVNMHDLVREVALWIANKDIQTIMDLKMTINLDLRYLFWKNDDFPNQFDGTKLEILLIFFDGSKHLKVPDAFFVEMTRLKVLILIKEEQLELLNLSHSLQSLKNIRTLILEGLKLGNISNLGQLSSLETFMLANCLIIELPREILKLKKLTLLDVRDCEIEMNNPFEVIERCSQLEELYFIDNEYDEEKKCAVSQDVSPPTLYRYQISFDELPYDFEKYGSISRCFRPDDLRHLVSEATFKQLVRTAELLMLGGYEETRWKNLIPDIVPMEDGGMNDLIILHLYSWPDIQCLIDTKNHYSDVTAFSKLVELHLSEMDVEDLYCGSLLPSSFLEQLETMKLRKCLKLHGILFNGKLNLCHLKVMELENCPVLTSIFQPSTARSLVQLEELIIKNCQALEYIITDKSSREEIVDDDGDNDQKSCGSLFPKLKTLRIAGCDKLGMILSVLFAGGLPSLEEISVCKCEKLEYIFDKYQEEDHVMLPSLKEMDLSGVPSLIRIFQEYYNSSMQRPSSLVLRGNFMEKLPNPDKRSFSWAHVCCFLHKSRARSEETNVAVSKERLLDHTIPQGLLESKKWFHPADTAQCFMRQLFNFHSIKKMELANISTLVSVSTLSMASMILWEELTIKNCDGLKHIITNEVDNHNDQINYRSIFPKLKKLEIWCCNELGFLFPTTLSIGLKNLKSLTINNAAELKYVVGKYHHKDHLSNQNQSDELHFDLPVLEFLCLQDIPKIISICVKNYYVAWPSLQNVLLKNCNIKSFTDLIVCSDEGQLNLKTTKELHASMDGVPPFHAAHSILMHSLNNIKKITLVNFSNLISLLTLPIASTMNLLENLTIQECHQLKCIVADEGDAQAHMNHNSIFPKLNELKVSECHALEYLFPASVFRSPVHLESVDIANAPELKYVFGTSHHEDSLSHEHQNLETYIDFPALKTLDLRDVPNLVSICPKNYCLKGLSLRRIVLVETSPEFTEFTIRSFTDFMVCSQARPEDSTTSKAIEKCLQTLGDLFIYDSKIEEIFSLTHLDVEKDGEGLEPLTSRLHHLELQNLSELRNICVGPKYILSLSDLSILRITECKKLKVVFSTSTLRSLPKLWYLKISNCEELVHIIEEDYEENAGDHLRHKPCFPKLRELFIECCDRLKYLFSITMSGILPELSYLRIKEASNLEHVLIRQGETKEMLMKDVLPELYCLDLDKLPSLVSLCHGIDFQTLEESSEVNNCPKFSFHETTTTQLQGGPKKLDSEVQAKTEEKLSSHLNTDQSDVGEARGRQDLETQQSTIGSPNFTKGTKEATKETVEGDLISEMPKMATLSTDSEFIGKLNNKEAGYSSVLEITDSDPSNAIPIRPVVILSQNASSKDELVGKEMKNETVMMDPQPLRETRLDIHSNDSENIIEVRDEEGASPETLHPGLLTSTKKVPIPESPDITILPAGGSIPTTAKIFEEEEEEEDGLISNRRHRSGIKAASSSLAEEPENSVHGDPFVPPTTMIASGQTSKTILPPCPVPSKASTSVERTPSSTPSKPTYGIPHTTEADSTAWSFPDLIYDTKDSSLCRGDSTDGRKDQDGVGTAKQPTCEAVVTVQVSGKSRAPTIVPSEGGNVEPIPAPTTSFEDVGDKAIKEASVKPSFPDTTHALTVPGVQEIVDMMKLEGAEPSMLAEAFETHPQLRLSTEDRSTWMLCISYRVLLNILNILATRTPFTITEADKRFLAENIKDASVLGFDKAWLESTETKVFNCDVSEVHRIQEVLKGLSDELKTNKTALALVRDQEAEAARVVEEAQKELEAALSRFNAAQQEHANVRVRQTQLSEACQGILERRDQCWETIAAKYWHFGF